MKRESGNWAPDESSAPFPHPPLPANHSTFCDASFKKNLSPAPQVNWERATVPSLKATFAKMRMKPIKGLKTLVNNSDMP